VKKLLIFSLFIFVALINSYGADRTGTIPTGLTMLSNPFTFAASDTVVTGTTTTYLISNPQKYSQNQVFTIGLTAVTGTHNMAITAYGKVAYGGSLAGGTWVQIGTPITWVTAANNGAITSASPVNYNYFKVTFVEGGTECKARVSQFEIKTSNAFDIPASSGTLTISRATTGTVTVQVKDDDANAAAVYRAGGTGALTVGAAAGTTAITSSDWAISATGVQTGMGAITTDGLITAAAGINLGTSQAIVGTTGLTIGNNGQTVAVNSSDWDIDATGIATNMGTYNGLTIANSIGRLVTTATASADSTVAGSKLSAVDQFVTVTAGGAARCITLPAAGATTVGLVIEGVVGANGFDLRVATADAMTVKLNDVTGAVTVGVEAAIPATSSFKVICVSATEWVLTATDEKGAVITAIVPDPIEK